MKQWLKQNKILVIFNAAILLSAAIAWILYTLLGYQLIEAMYQGKSIGFLNTIIEGQRIHPLEHYHRAGDRLIWIASSMVISLSIASIVLTILTNRFLSVQPSEPEDVSGASGDHLLKRIEEKNTFENTVKQMRIRTAPIVKALIATILGTVVLLVVVEIVSFIFLSTFYTRKDIRRGQDLGKPEAKTGYGDLLADSDESHEAEKYDTKKSGH